MKKIIFLTFLSFNLSTKVNSQDIIRIDTIHKKLYTTTNIEFIFSFADADSLNKSFADIVRFTCFLNLQEFVHWDPSNNVGFFSGGAIRNIGFIYKDNDVMTKMRSYAIGIPVGIKVGDLKNNFYIYGGGELEYMFWFKRKVFQNDEKTIYEDWFSDRTNTLIPSVFAGVQFPKGINVKFKYYLDNFLNPDFAEYKNGVAYKPYQNWDTHMFYFSVSFNFRNKAISYRGRRLLKGVQAHLSGKNHHLALKPDR